MVKEKTKMIEPSQPGIMNRMPERSRTDGLAPIEGIHNVIPRIGRIQIPGKGNASTVRIEALELAQKKTENTTSLQEMPEIDNRRIRHNSQT